jgi:hypothetical protein
MPARNAYIGAVGGGESYPSIPMQTETSAYFARFSTPPSRSYRNALNRAIYMWKRAGVYVLAQDLWLFLADTQTDALRNLVSAGRDATIVGTLTFTPNKGFSGNGGANYLSLPHSTSGLAAASSGFAFAVKCNTAVGGSLGTTNNNQLGYMNVSNVAPYGVVGAAGGSPSQIGGSNFAGSAVPYVLGQVGAAIIDPVRQMAMNGSVGTFFAVAPSPMTLNGSGGGWPGPLAVAWFPTITVAQMRRFLTILNSLLDELGAI